MIRVKKKNYFFGNSIDQKPKLKKANLLKSIETIKNLDGKNVKKRLGFI